MEDEEIKHNDELLEVAALDLDDAFDDALELNDEGMESLEENFDDYEGPEDDSLGLENLDAEY